jgi:hypothetical protein
MPSRSLSFLEEIRRAIDEVDRVVVVIGPRAIASEYVRAEWLYGMTIDKPVVPILRAGKNPKKPTAKDHDLLPAEMKNLHTPDFRVNRSFTKACQELLRKLREPLPPLGQLHTAVPGAPPHFQPQPNDLTRIAASVLPDWKKPAVVEGLARLTIVHGMGGAGKSVLAAVFARLTETRRAFPDGVVWLSYLESLSTLDALRLAGSALHDDLSRYVDGPSASASLAKALHPLRCLLVLDNVTHAEQVEPFAKTLGPNGRLLITSRDAGLATSFGATSVPVGELSREAVRVHLADWVGTAPDTLPAEALAVAARCAGLPFATAICGAMVREGTSWSDLLSKLDRADLAFLKARFPDYPYPTVLLCLQASVDLLHPAERDRYAELRIFAATQPVPESVIVRLWTRDGIMSASDARRLIVTLFQRALLRVQSEGNARRISVHDLQHDLLRATYPEAKPIHEEMVRTYREACGGDWTHGPEDGYYFSYLVLHLLRSGQKDEAIRLLTGSDAWFRYKRFRPEHQTGLLADLGWCLLAEPSALEVAQLCAVRQLIWYGATAYCDTDLKSLLLLGRKDEALNQARLRINRVKIIEGLLAVCESGVTDPDVHSEIESRVRSLSEPYDRARLIARFACLLAHTQRARAKALAIEALRLPRADPESTSWSEYTSALSVVLRALLQTALVPQALRFIDAVKDDDWRTYFLSRLGVHAAEENAGACLNSVLTRIRRSTASSIKSPLALAEIAATAARSGDKPSARRILRDAERVAGAAQLEDSWLAPASSKRVRIQVRLAEANALLGTDQAMRLFGTAEQEIQGREIDNFLRAELFVDLAEDLVASELFDEARRVALQPSIRQLDRGRILEHLVGALSRRGNVQEAVREAAAIESMEGRAGAFSQIALALARLRHQNLAAEYLRRAVETRQSYDAQSHTVGAVAQLAEALLPQKPASAQALVDSAVQAARSLPQDYDYSRSIKEVVVCCCRAGRLADAESLLKSIRNETFMKEAAAELAKALATDGKLDAAVTLARSRLNGDALFSCLAGVHKRAGRWDEALAAANSIQRCYARTTALAETGAAMARAEEARATVVFREARELAETTDGCRLALATIAYSLVSCTWLDDAWQIAESIETGWEATKARLHVAAALARRGDKRGIEIMHIVSEACAAETEREPILMFAAALSQAGFVEDTVAAASELRSDYHRTESLFGSDIGLDQPDGFDILRWLAELGLIPTAIQNLQVDSLDRYLEELAVLALALDNHRAGMSAPLIKESVRIAGWVRADWHRMQSLIQ